MLPRLYRTDSEIRKRQINTLKVFNDNVTEIQEGSEYAVLFNAGRREVCLHVSLTADFPKERPILKVAPVLLHHWVNTEGEITSAPGLLNFTIHSDLGRVVQAIIREFERTPPPLASEHSSSIVSATVAVTDADTKIRSYSSQSFSPPSSSGICDSTAFPTLNALSVGELCFLNVSVDRQDEFLETLPRIQEMSRSLDDAIAQVEELAESNLSKQKLIEDSKRQLDTRIEEVTKLAFENERLYGTYQMLSNKYSPRNIKELLRKAAESSNSESEKVADAFLSGSMDVDKFVSLYIHARALSQARKTKEEKLSQQLDSLEKAGF